MPLRTQVNICLKTKASIALKTPFYNNKKKMALKTPNTSSTPM